MFEDCGLKIRMWIIFSMSTMRFFFFLFYAEQTKGKGGGTLLHDLRDDE